MAALVLTAVGGYFFGPVGALAGSLLGSLLFPGPGQEGPRLQSLKLQGSTYGQMIPILFGQDRIAPQVVWQTDLVEHKNVSGGKGSGPKVTTYSYTLSFASKICKGPVLGVATIWANGEVIYDTTGTYAVDNSIVPITIYLGVESALPDPTMEAELGVGNVPAFRDDCTIVFTDWDVGKWGNTIPQLNCLVYTATGISPSRVSTWNPPRGTGNAWVAGGQIVNGQLLIGVYDNISGFTFDSCDYTLYTFALDGTLLTTGATIPVVAGVTRFAVFGVANNPHIGYAQLYQQGGGSPTASAWVVDGVLRVPVAPPVGTESLYSAEADSPCYATANYVYAIGGTGANGEWVARYTIMGDGFPHSTALDFNNPPALVYYSFPGGPFSGNYQVTVDENGLVYVAGPDGGGNRMLMQFDDALNLLDTWTGADYPSANDGGFQIKVHGGRILIGAGLLSQVFTLGHPMAFVGSIPVALQTPANYPMSDIGGCYAMSNDGIINMCPPPGPVTLASIVTSISLLCGLSTGEINVEQLETVLVDGYLLTTRADGRTDLDGLRPAYQFDGVDSNGIAKFVLRGGVSVVTIPDTDLAAHVRGSATPELLEITRMQELDLPVSVNVKYKNLGASFQPGTQIAQRQTVAAQAVAEVELAIVMSDSKARQIANVLLYVPWLERMSFRLRTALKYLYLEPTDIITTRGYEMRLERKMQTVVGVLEWEAKQTNAAVYFVGLSGNVGTPGTIPIAAVGQATQLVLLDIPLTEDTDPSQTIKAAMAGAVNSTWRGATLYKSADAINYLQQATSTTPNVIGTAANALGNFYGGNIVDESNVLTLLVGAGGGALASTDYDGLLNGENTLILGFEEIQFRDAVLTAPDTYDCTGLLRGRRGTEFAIGAHAVGETFVLLPAVDVPAPLSELGQSRHYKAVTLGQTIAAANAQAFTNSGMSLRPYSPVQFAGGPIDPFDGTVQMNWMRRTRIGGAWVDYTDVLLSEPSEGYVVQIWDASFTFCARVITGITSPTCTYSAADQVTDFGATQLEIYATVGQLGAYTLGVQTRATIPGLGATIDAPLNPVMPYNGSPVPATGGGGTVNSTLTWPSDQDTTIGYVIGDTWVSQFTTSASGPITGHVDASEFQFPAYYRHIFLCTDAAGANQVPNGQAWGNQAGFIFGTGASDCNLSTATTYYFVVKSELPNGNPSGTPGDPAQMHITLVGAPP